MTLKLSWMAKTLMIVICFLYTPTVFSTADHLRLAEDDESTGSSNTSHVTGTYNSEEEQKAQPETPTDSGTEGRENGRTEGMSHRETEGRENSRTEGMSHREEAPRNNSEVQGESKSQSTGFQVQEGGKPQGTGQQVPATTGSPASTGYQVHGTPSAPATSTGFQVQGTPSAPATSTGFQVEGPSRYYKTEYYYPQEHQFYIYEGYRWAPYYEHKIPRGADILYYKRGLPVYACSVKFRGVYYLGKSIAGGPCYVKIRGKMTPSAVFSIRF